MTLETLRFLRDMLSRQQISAEIPNLAEVAKLVQDARDELDAEIVEHTKE